LHQFIDNAELSGVKIDPQTGFLVADAKCVRTGIQKYAGFEVGRPDLAVVNVFRPETEVFHKDSLQSFSHAPVTNDHPPVGVTADNWKDYAVGEASTDVLRDGQRLHIPLIVKDKATIAVVRDGKRELSAGYTCDLVWESGTAPDGSTYDAVQKNIRANHIAIVSRGRAGTECRIGDSATGWGAAPVNDTETPVMNMRNVLVDGITIQTTDQGAQAIEKLNKQLADATTDNIKLVTDHAAAIAAKDAEIGTLKAENKKLADSIPTADALDRLTRDRADVITKAQALNRGIVTDGKTSDEIKRLVCTAVLGDKLVTKDTTDAEINGMFLTITKDVKVGGPGSFVSDPVRDAMIAQGASPAARGGFIGAMTDSQAAYEKRIADQWKQDRDGAAASAAAR
jgi:hypothetical protein